MKMRLLSAALLAFGAISLSAASASAGTLTSVSCGSGSVTADNFGSATACEGALSGNDTGAGNPLLISLNNGLFGSFVGDATWELLGKSDDANSIFTADNDKTSGTWSILTAITSPFVISLKAGNSYSAYFFDGKTPITSGTFNTLGISVNGKGNAQALSHASLFVVKTETPVKETPEPATVAALGMFAIGGLGALRQKKR